MAKKTDDVVEKLFVMLPGDVTAALDAYIAKDLRQRDPLIKRGAAARIALVEGLRSLGYLKAAT